MVPSRIGERVQVTNEIALELNADGSYQFYANGEKKHAITADNFRNILEAYLATDGILPYGYLLAKWNLESTHDSNALRRLPGFDDNFFADVLVSVSGSHHGIGARPQA